MIYFLRDNLQDFNLKGKLYSQNIKIDSIEKPGAKLKEESEDGYSVLLYLPLPVLLIALIIYDLIDKKRKRKKNQQSKL